MKKTKIIPLDIVMGLAIVFKSQKTIMIIRLQLNVISIILLRTPGLILISNHVIAIRMQHDKKGSRTAFRVVSMPGRFLKFQRLNLSNKYNKVDQAL
jgi:hypothetical protein